MASNDVKSDEKHENKTEQNEGQQGEVTALFDQPLVLEGKRKRKSVDMFAFSPKTTPAKKKPEYEGGDGVQLGDVPIIQYNINKTKSDELKTLYKLCFDTTISIGRVLIKKKLRLFSGWKFDEESDDYKKRKGQLERMLNVNLQAVLDFLGLEKNGTKEEMVKRILNYLTKPYDTGKVPPTPRKKRKSSTADDSKGNKKRKTDDGEEEEEEEEDEEEEEEEEEDSAVKDGQSEEKGKETPVKEKKQNDKKVKAKKEAPPKEDVAMETQNEDNEKEGDDDKVTNNKEEVIPSLQTPPAVDTPKEE